IGTDVTGNLAVPNGWEGVAIGGGASSNRIGADPGDANAASEPNVISGNVLMGVSICRVFSGPGTQTNLVSGNHLGSNAAGTQPLPNQGDGVLVQSAAPNNINAGATAAARNVISGNAGAGLTTTDTGTTGTLVQGNYIGTDVTGAIDLGNARD